LDRCSRALSGKVGTGFPPGKRVKSNSWSRFSDSKKTETALVASTS
jgi:hypothetical protein